MNILQSIVRFFNQVFTQPIKIGESSVSLSLIFGILVALLGVIIGSGYLSKFLTDKLLVKLRVQEGKREAIASLFRYFTITIGFLLIPQAAGLDMSSLAFLAGGLGIGIGFGFQRLAQNFVSGFILLFERPVQVGDYVELGDLEGTIREISIRSTLVFTNDGIAIIVPNSDLVSNRIINWSYDNVNSRIHIPVRVACGSDPVVVTEALLSAAYREPRVLSHPSPQVWLSNFGEDSMNFELLVWINRPQARLPIQSALNYIIQHELRYNNIQMPVTQREVCIRNPEVLSSLFESVRSPQNLNGIEEVKFQEGSDNNCQNYLNLSLRHLLRQVVYFEKFTDIEIRNLIEKGYRQTVSPGQFIFHEGDPGDAFHIILSGAVEILAEKANKYIRTLEAGDFFGELALIMGIPRSAAVRAVEPTILFVVSREVFKSFLSSYPQLADQMAEKLVERKEELIQRQQMLRELGILEDDDLEQNPMIWIRKRMRSLFGI